MASAEWADWCNFRRLHGEIGHVPPAEYEATYYLTATKPQVTTRGGSLLAAPEISATLGFPGLSR